MKRYLIYFLLVYLCLGCKSKGRFYKSKQLLVSEVWVLKEMISKGSQFSPDKDTVYLKFNINNTFDIYDSKLDTLRGYFRIRNKSEFKYMYIPLQVKLHKYYGYFPSKIINNGQALGVINSIKFSSWEDKEFYIMYISDIHIKYNFNNDSLSLVTNNSDSFLFVKHKHNF